MKTACLIDLENKNITLEGGYEAKRLIIDFIAVGEDDQKYDFKNVSFGYQIQKNGGEIVEESWPVPGIKFGKLPPGGITSADIKLEIDTHYKLLVWLTQGTHRQTDIRIFNSGKPFKAYESMIWNEEEEDWEMLKPYPEDATEPMVWNEEILEWEIIKFEEEEVDEN